MKTTNGISFCSHGPLFQSYRCPLGMIKNSSRLIPATKFWTQAVALGRWVWACKHCQPKALIQGTRQGIASSSCPRLSPPTRMELSSCCLRGYCVFTGPQTAVLVLTQCSIFHFILSNPVYCIIILFWYLTCKFIVPILFCTGHALTQVSAAIGISHPPATVQIRIYKLGATMFISQSKITHLIPKHPSTLGGSSVYFLNLSITLLS